MKASLLGPFYLLSLRADLVGRTLVGLRVDDAIRAIDYLTARADVDPARITAKGSGHMGLVLLHAGVLDHRMRPVEVDHVLTSYRDLVEGAAAIGAPEDRDSRRAACLNIPDLERALKPRLKESDPLKGTDDLSQDSTPLSSLAGATPWLASQPSSSASRWGRCSAMVKRSSPNSVLAHANQLRVKCAGLSLSKDSCMKPVPAVVERSQRRHWRICNVVCR